MAATITWTISTLERDLIGDLAGGVIVAHWRVNASQEDSGETYTATNYGTQSFTPDPAASDYIAYDQLTEADVIGWCQSALDKDAIEAGLQSAIDLQITPQQATGVPW